VLIAAILEELGYFDDEKEKDKNKNKKDEVRDKRPVQGNSKNSAEEEQ
jgi:hypothetical protein